VKQRLSREVIDNFCRHKKPLELRFLFEQEGALKPEASKYPVAVQCDHRTLVNYRTHKATGFFTRETTEQGNAHLVSFPLEWQRHGYISPGQYLNFNPKLHQGGEKGIHRVFQLIGKRSVQD